nr:hypothetical protein [Tanacetum cinerariifolium]
MVFLSSPGSTNEVDTHTIQVSTVGSPVTTVSSHDNIANLSDATVYAFLDNQPNGSQLVHEDLEQIHEDDLEKINLKWQLALLSMRMGHFAREFRSPRNQEIRPRNQDNSRKSVNVEDTSSKAMVAINRVGFDWSYMADDEIPTNMALMAFSDSKVHDSKTCSNTCLKSFKTLKTQYENLRIEFNKSEFDLATYKRGLEEFQHPEFKGYRIKDIKSVCVDTSNEIKKAPNAPIIEDWVFDSDEDESEEMVLKFNNVQHKPEQANQPRKTIQKHVFKNVEKGTIQREVRPVWNNAMRTTHQNFFNSRRNFAPTAVLTKSGIVPISTARQNDLQKSQSLSRRPFYQQTTLNRNLDNKVNTAKGDPQDALKDQGYFDSGCSGHMTGNISYLIDFKKHHGGYVAFGGGAKGGKITVKGTIRTDKLDFEDLYFVKELQFNLFSVSQTILKSFITEIENLVEKKVKIIRYDNGSEFKNRVMNEFFKEKGIKREYSVARTPQQNGIAERRNRTLIKEARIMVLVVKPHFKTPYELLKGRSPALNFMRPFGCHVTILNTLEQLGKFDGKLDEGIFVGYSTNSKTFRVYNTRTRKVEENLHITFLENKPMITGGGPEWLFNIDALSKSMNYALVPAGINSNDFVRIEASFDAGQSSMEIEPSQDYILMPLWKNISLFDYSLQASDGHNKDNHGPSQASESDNQERPNAESSTKTINTIGPVNTAAPTYDDYPKADYNNLETVISVSPIPSTRIHKDHPKEQVIGEVNFAVQTRKMAKQNEAWLITFINKQRRIIFSLRWNQRRDQRGIVVRNKARLVAQGYRQEEGIDYDEVFASVAQIEAIRLFLAYASFMDFTVYQMNVKSAFLYGTMEEEVYVSQPLGFVDPEFPNGVYMVEKALYGLHQAPSAWPNIMFAMCACSRFQVQPKVSHMHAVKRIFRYLNGQPTLGLWYPKYLPLELIAYSGSDYAGASLDRKSTTKDCQFLSSRLISWQCKKQTIVANSTTEAEYIAASNCCGQTKHIEIRHHFIRDSYEKRFIEMVKIHTNYNVADLLTEAFDVTRQERIGYSRANDNLLRIFKSVDEQFWNTASSKTINSVKQIHALVDGGGDNVERAITTDASLEAAQASDNILKTQTTAMANVDIPLGMDTSGGPRRQETMGDNVPPTPYDSPRTGGYMPGSDEGLHHSHQKSEKLKTQLKQKRSRVVIYSSGEEEPSVHIEESPKQERMIKELDKDEDVNLVSQQGEVQEIAKPSKDDDDTTLAETLLNIKRRTTKDRRKGIISKLYAEELAKETARQEQEKYNMEKALELQRQLDKKEKDVDKAKVRKNMVMYLKNRGWYKKSYFKGMKYEDIRPIFKRVWDQVHTFVPKDLEIEKEVMKRSGFHFQQESPKKQKLEHKIKEKEEEVEAQADSDQEVEEMKLYMRIVFDEDIAIDAISLATKPPVIVEYKIVKEGKINTYHITRADGNTLQ